MNIAEKVLAMELLLVTDDVKMLNNIPVEYSHVNGCELIYYRLDNGSVRMYSHEYLESKPLIELL